MAVSFIDLLFGSFVVTVILAVIVAPIAEEATKGYGIMKMKKSSEFDEPEDGGVYGATVGLGFAFFENFLYFVVAWREYVIEKDPSDQYVALYGLIFLIVIRSIASACLHGASSGFFGISVGREKFMGDDTWKHGFQTAVVLHATFNAIAIFSAVIADDYPLIAFSMLLMLVFFGIGAFRKLHDEIIFLEYAYLQRKTKIPIIKMQYPKYLKH